MSQANQTSALPSESNHKNCGRYINVSTTTSSLSYFFVLAWLLAETGRICGTTAPGRSVARLAISPANLVIVKDI